jgi:hypothetical protein
MPNAVKKAIDRLGGPTPAVVKTGIPTSTWVRWRRKGWISDARWVLEIAKMTDIPPDELARPKQ